MSMPSDPPVRSGLKREIGIAFSRLRGAGSIVVGRDMRLSSSSLAASFIEGCAEGDSSVVDLGMTSTAMLHAPKTTRDQMPVPPPPS